MADYLEEQASDFEMPAEQVQVTAPATVSQDPPVKTPKKELTYEEASRQIDNASASKLPFYNTGFLAPQSVETSQAKPYLDEQYGYMAGQDNEDFYAKQQSWYESAGKGLLSLPALTLTKVGTGVGFTLGLLNPVNWFAEEGVISAASDNGMAELFGGLEDTVKNDWLNIYQEAADRNKGFFSRAFTDLNFWTEDVVDGAAFMASAFIPGMALAKLGAGAKLAQGLSALRLDANSAGKVVNGMEVAQTYLGNAARLKRGFDTTTTWALATAGESMFEAKEVRNHVMDSLNEVINPETGVFYTDKEKKEIAGGAARNTFLMNAALLGLTNVVQMKYLFKTFNMGSTTTGSISQKALGETFEKALPTTKIGKFLDSTYGKVAKGLAIGTASEGFVEENTQLAIQRMNQEYGSLGKIAGMQGYLDLVPRVGEQTLDALAGEDTEASTSIGLGAILGGGMTAVGEARGNKREKLTTALAVAQLNMSQENWLKFGNIHQTETVTSTDAEGNEVTEERTILDANNQPIIDQEKMARAIAGFSGNMDMVKTADGTLDVNKSKHIQDLAFADFVQAHVNAGIENTLIEKLDLVNRAKPEELAGMGFDPASLSENISDRVSDLKVLAADIIDRNKLIKNSLLATGDPRNEQARKTKLIELATQQAITNRTIRNVETQTGKIKGSVMSSDDSSLNDNTVDVLNSLEYRIRSQKATLDMLNASPTRSAFQIKAAKAQIEELEKQKKKLFKDNEETISTLNTNEDGLYEYENPARNQNPLNIAYQQKLMEKAAYQNAARHNGLQFAAIMDTKNGLKNFMEHLESDVVAPLNQVAEEEEKEAETIKAAEALAAVTPAAPPAPGLPPFNGLNPNSTTTFQPTATTPVSTEFPDGTETPAEEIDLLEGSQDIAPKSEVEPMVYKNEKLISGKEGWFIVEKAGEFYVMDVNRKDESGSWSKSPFYELAKAEEFRDTLIENALKKDQETLLPFAFDNQSVQYGQIFIEKATGQQWVVNSKGKPHLDRKKEKIFLELLNPDRSRNGRVIAVSSLDKYTPKFKSTAAPTATGALPKFKLVRENELTRIYPHQAPGESKTLAQERLDKVLSTIPLIDLANGITIKVTRKEGKRVANPVIGDPATQSPNRNLYQAPDALTMEVRYKGNTLGYITNYDNYTVVDRNGNPISTEALSLAQFKEIFDTERKDPKTAMAEFKEHYRRSKRLAEAMYGMLNGKNSVELDNETVNKLLGITVGNGQFDFVKQDEATPEVIGAALEDLEHSTINGHTFVMDRKRTYGKNDTFNTEPIYITTAVRKERQALVKEVEDAMKSGRDATQLLGRYVAVVKLPNGTIRFVELNTEKYSDQQLEDLVGKINERSKLTKENNLVTKTDAKVTNIGVKGETAETYIGGDNPNYNAQLNEEIVENLFISVPLAASGSSIDFYVNAVGNLQLKVSRKLPGERESKKNSVSVSEKDIHTPLNFTNADEMIARLNAEIEKHNKKARSYKDKIDFTLTRDNFKQAVPKTSGVAIVRSMRTGVNPRIVKNIPLSYVPKADMESHIPVPEKPLKEAETPLVTTLPAGTKYQKVEVDPKAVAALQAATGQGPASASMLDALNKAAADFAAGSATTPTAEVNNALPTNEEIPEVVSITPTSTVTATSNAPLITSAPPKTKSDYEVLQQEKEAWIDNRTNEIVSEGKLKQGRAFSQATKEAMIIYDEKVKAIKDRILREKNTALKVTDRDNFTEEEIVHIDKFKAWIRQNFPDFITVEETDEFSNRLKKNGITVGMFVSYMEVLQNGTTKVKGNIRVGAETPFKYHEAFHAVFRLLLPQNRINQLLEIAKREDTQERKKSGKSLQKALIDFKLLHPTYAALKGKELENRYYEEYLADKFDAWKLNKSVPTSHMNKGFFAQIWEWITNLFKKNDHAELMGMFSEIDTGKYRTSRVAQNEFTKETALTMNLPVMKAIKVGDIPVLDENGNDIIIEKFLSQVEGDQISATVAALYYQRALSRDSDAINKNQLLEQILDDYRELYNPDKEFYLDQMDEMDAQALRVFSNKLQERNRIFTDPENRQSIKEAVDVHLRLMGFKQRLESDELEDMEDEYGSRITTDNWKETHSMGGVGSLSAYLRQYIATTFTLHTDEFGNSSLKEGVPLIQAVNADLVYNGILKAVANISDGNKIMARLRLLRDNGTETGKFIEKFFNDAGVVFDEHGNFNTTNEAQAQLITQVIKGFNQYNVDYIFINKDVSSEKKVAHLMLANRRDAAKTQFSIWQQAYIEVFETQAILRKTPEEKQKFFNERTGTLQDFYTLMDPDQAMSNEKWSEEADEISNGMKNDLGISLSPMFVKHALIYTKDPSKLTPEQVNFLRAYDDIISITREDINQMIGAVKRGENPFAKNIESLENNEPEIAEDQLISTVDDKIKADPDDLGKGGVVTRLNKIAKANAMFDETVYSSSFKNADGELVYGHQLPTYHLVRVSELNDAREVAKLKEDVYLTDNYLLNDEAYQALQGILKISRIEGAKSSVMSENEEGGWSEDRSMSANKNKGVTYGSFSAREFATSLMDLYSFNKEHRLDNGASFMTSQNLIRVLESSNTGDTVNLPVFRAVTLDNTGEVTLAEKSLSVLKNEVKTEVERIKRVRKELTLDPVTGTYNFIEGEVDGYHYKTDDKTGKRDYGKGRGLQFYKTGLMLGAELSAEILEALDADPNFNVETMFPAIEKQLQAYWKNSIKEYTAMLADLNVISEQERTEKDIREGKPRYINNLIGSFIDKGFTRKENSKDVANENKNALLNLIPGNLEHNIAQVFMNDYINTLSFNQILLGDQAQSLKDAIDEVKRAKGANGSGASLESFLIAPKMGIDNIFTESHIVQLEDPPYMGKFDGKTGEKANAQMWMTVKSMRYTLHGLGKLSPEIARILDKIERGQSLTANEVFGFEKLKDQGSMFNSIKLVYYDGKMYIKTSGFMLTKELTSRRDENNKWVAKLGMEELHNLREKLEDYESRNNTVAMAIPKSGSKGLKRNVARDINSIGDDNFNTQQTKYWRLQLENPSNKIVITDPTQAKQIILGEQDESLVVSFMGQDTTIGDLKRIYMTDTSQRSRNNYRDARNGIFTMEGAYDELYKSRDINSITPKLKKFQEDAIEILMATGGDSQLIEFFSVDDKLDKTKYNLNNPITLDKYTQLFLAYFSKGVMSEKIPGHSVALVSNFGMKKVKRFTGRYQEDGAPIGEIIRDDLYMMDPEFYKDAKVWNNEMDREFTDLKEGDYYVDDLRHNVPEFNEKGEITGYFTEFMMPAHFKELLSMLPEDKINEVLSKMFGVRIPSQDKHSLVTLKLVDFMPAFYGSSAVFPHELIEISGADFDIDKLYIHIADMYSKEGKLVPFGTAVTDQEKYDEYLLSQFKYNKNFKKTYKQIQDEQARIRLEDGAIDESTAGEKAVYDDQVDMIHDIMNLKNDLVLQLTLAELRLPLRAEDYKQAVARNGEMNNGVLNNRILEAKIKLMNNPHIVGKGDKNSIGFEIASVDPLIDIVKGLEEDFPEVDELMDIVQEGKVDNDTLMGKFKAYRNNKEGARNIGPAVNALLAYSTLSSFKIRFRRFFKIADTTDEHGKKGVKTEDMYRMTYEGKELTGYENMRSWNKADKAYTGERINGIISTIASAMMDNAKERLAARLGLNINAVGYLANMVAQGMPLKSAIRFLLQPAIRKYFSDSSIIKNKIKVGSEYTLSADKMLAEMIAEYGADLEEVDKVTMDMNITDEMLDNGLRTNGSDKIQQWIILQHFRGIKNQSKSFGQVAQVLKLTKGMGTSWETLDKIMKNIKDLGLRMDEDAFERSEIPFDMRQTFMAEDPKRPFHVFVNNYIKMADEISFFAKTMFIEKTDIFRRIQGIVMANLDVRFDNLETFVPTLKKDLISYLSIKSYMKSLADKGNTVTLSTMKQGTIYDVDALAQGKDFNDVIDTFRLIRQEMPDNYITGRFLNAISTQRGDTDNELIMNELNRDGINKIESNTWAKLSEYQVEKLKDSFIEIYQHSDEMRQHAVALFNYLLVKDGGQFKSNSFIRFIPNFMFDGLLKGTDRANEILKANHTDLTQEQQENLDDKYVQVFGVKSTELFNDFMKNYTTHIANAYDVKKVLNQKVKIPLEYAQMPEVKEFDPEKDGSFIRTDKQIRINIFNGVRPYKVEVDLGTTQGIIYVNNPDNGKRYEKGTAEMGKFIKNMEILKSKGFHKNDKGGFDYPYVIRFQGDNFSDAAWYVLKSVGKKKKGTKASAEEGAVPNQVIKKGETIANGAMAVYERLEMKGSRRQWAAGGVFGPIPVLPKIPRKRKQFDQHGRFGLDYTSFGIERDAAYYENQISDEHQPVQREKLSFDPIDVLNYTYGIRAQLTSKGWVFEGKFWDMGVEKGWDKKVKNPYDLVNLLTGGKGVPGVKMREEVQFDPGQDFTAGEYLEDYSQSTGRPVGEETNNEPAGFREDVPPPTAEFISTPTGFNISAGSNPEVNQDMLSALQEAAKKFQQEGNNPLNCKS